MEHRAGINALTRYRENARHRDNGRSAKIEMPLRTAPERYAAAQWPRPLRVLEDFDAEGHNLHALRLVRLLLIALLACSVSPRVQGAIVTAYCACRACCGPDAAGIAANGKAPRQGVTVAAPRRVPFGTVVWIRGVGRRVVQDRTAIRYDGRWDVYFDRHQDAVRFGKRQIAVRQPRKTL